MSAKDVTFLDGSLNVFYTYATKERITRTRKVAASIISVLSSTDLEKGR